MYFIAHWGDIAGKYGRRYSPLSSYANYFIHQLNALQEAPSPPVFFSLKIYKYTYIHDVRDLPNSLSVSVKTDFDYHVIKPTRL